MKNKISCKIFFFQIFNFRQLDLKERKLTNAKLANRLYILIIIEDYLSDLILLESLDSFLEMVFLLNTPFATDLCISG